MTSFPLKIVTPDGLLFDGQAEQLTVRTATGDMGVLAGHANCVAPLGMGRAAVVSEGKRRYAACIGGILSVLNGEVRLVPTTFEWAEDIDAARAESAVERARAILADKAASDADRQAAKARLMRAQVRKAIADQHAAHAI